MGDEEGEEEEAERGELDREVEAGEGKGEVGEGILVVGEG